MRWGPPKEKKKKPKYQLWFAWYPVRLYKGRWMWWEWCIRTQFDWLYGQRCYETFFEGVLPDLMRKNMKNMKKGWQ
jgi:hypothetical protein